MAKAPTRFDGPAAEMRAALARCCEAMADLTLDGRWRSAAGILTGKRAGRQPVDDGPALAYAEALLTQGLAPTKHKAAEMAAKVFSRSHQVASTRDRLRKKLRTQIINSEDTATRRA